MSGTTFRGGPVIQARTREAQWCVRFAPPQPVNVLRRLRTNYLPRPDGRVAFEEIYERYGLDCDHASVAPISRTALRAVLLETFPFVRRRGTGGGTGFIGLSLSAHAAAPHGKADLWRFVHEDYVPNQRRVSQTLCIGNETPEAPIVRPPKRLKRFGTGNDDCRALPVPSVVDDGLLAGLPILDIVAGDERARNASVGKRKRWQTWTHIQSAASRGSQASLCFTFSSFSSCTLGGLKVPVLVSEREFASGDSHEHFIF